MHVPTRRWRAANTAAATAAAAAATTAATSTTAAATAAATTAAATAIHSAASPALSAPYPRWREARGEVRGAQPEGMPPPVATPVGIAHLYLRTPRGGGALAAHAPAAPPEAAPPPPEPPMVSAAVAGAVAEVSRLLPAATARRHVRVLGSGSGLRHLVRITVRVWEATHQHELP